MFHLFIVSLAASFVGCVLKGITIVFSLFKSHWLAEM